MRTSDGLICNCCQLSRVGEKPLLAFRATAGYFITPFSTMSIEKATFSLIDSGPNLASRSHVAADASSLHPYRT